MRELISHGYRGQKALMTRLLCRRDNNREGASNINLVRKDVMDNADAAVAADAAVPAAAAAAAESLL